MSANPSLPPSDRTIEAAVDAQPTSDGDDETRDHSAILRCRVLGPVTVCAPDGVARLPRPQAALAIAVLATRAPRGVSNDIIADVIWNGARPPSASSLRTAMLHARQSFASPLQNDTETGDASRSASAVEPEPDGYRLNLDPWTIDRHRFEVLCVAAHRAWNRGEVVRAAHDVSAALDLWRGEPYGGLDHDAVRIDAEHLRNVRRDAEELLVDCHLRSGDASTAANLAESLVGAEPYRERRWQQLMVATYHCDRQADSLRAFQRAAHELAEGLGLSPSDRLRATETAVLQQDDGSLQSLLGWPDEPSGSDGRARAMTEMVGSQRMLPASGSTFVGRATEIETLRAALGRGRMVTITAMGGMGKTRLAVEFANRCEPNAVFVDLSNTTSGEVLTAVMSSIGIHGTGSTSDSLVRVLRPLDTFLILDNCELLIGEVAELAERLLRDCPAVRLLLTSRAPLRCEHETRLQLGSLAGPDATALLDQRVAQAGIHGKNVLDGNHGLLAQLDGVPLAIELAASQLADRTPDELRLDLAGRLDTIAAPNRSTTRHRDLETSLRWSYEQLSDRARHVFAGLGCLAGQFIAEDAVAVVQLDSYDVRRSLGELAAHSLVAATHSPVGMTYAMLVPVRTFADSVLSAEDRAVGVKRHIAHFGDVATWVESAISSPSEADARRRADIALDQIRAAFRRGLDVDPSAAAQLTIRLGGFARAALQYDVQRWPAELLEIHEIETGPDAAELYGLAALTEWSVGNAARTAALIAKSAEAAERHSTPIPHSTMMANVNSAGIGGDLAASLEALETERSWVLDHGDPVMIATSHVVAALGAVMFGLQSAAEREAQAARSAAHRSANPSTIAWAMYGSAVALLDHRPADAERVFSDGFELANSVGGGFVSGMNLAGLITARRRTGVESGSGPLLADLIELWFRGNHTSQLAQAFAEAALHLAPGTHREVVSDAVSAATSISLGMPSFPADRQAVRDLVVADERSEVRALQWHDADRVAQLVTELTDVLRHSAR